MFQIIYLLTKLYLVSSMYSIMFWENENISKLCLSNNSPLEGLVYYWENVMKEGDFKEEKRKKCRIGPSDLKRVTNQTLTTLIEEVQKSPSEIQLLCEEDGNKTGISMFFDGLSDDISTPSIVDCNGNIRISDLRVQVGRGHFEKENEIRKIEEIVTLEDDLRRERDLNKLLQDLNKKDAEERRIIEHELTNMREQLQRERERSKQQIKEHEKIEVNNHKEPATHLNVSKLLTIGLLAQQVGQVIATEPGQLNTWIHAKNRIGKGLYKTEDTDEDGCRGLDYGVSCLGFDYLLRTDIYPFFNSFVSHLSMLEASTEDLIEKEGTSCEIETNKEFKCYEERAFIKGSCPHLVNSAHFLDNKGKLRIVKCKTDFEMTEDCTFCRKIKKKNSQHKQVFKTSIALQDAVCQNNSDLYNGPRIVYSNVCKIGMVSYKQCKSKTSSYESVGFVILKGKGKFYIENMKIKNIEVIANVSFICHQYQGQDGTEKEQRSLKRISVGECKSVNPQKTKHCTGDHVFCEKYDCTKSYPEVTCLMAPGSGPILVQIMGSWIKPQCVGYEKVLVEREVKSPTLTEERDCDTCVYECLEDKILIKSTGFKMISAVACSHGMCVSSHQEPSTFLYINYPGMSASIGGEIGLHLSHTDDSLSLHKVISCPSRNPCDVHSCIICYHGIINYQCHTALSYTIVAFSFISFLYLTFKVISQLLYTFKVVPKKLKGPFYWMGYLIKWIVKTILGVVRNTFFTMSNRIGWERRDEIHEDIEANPRRHLQRFKTTFVLTMLMINGGLCCSNTLVSNSKQTRCVQSGNEVKCSVSATVVLKAGVIGAESCFIIKGPSENQHKMISVRTLSSETVCREGASFWTGHFSPSCVSSRRCHLVGECHGNRCQSWRDDQISREFGGVKDNNRMSENKCFEQCGSIGCGCFNMNPSCLYVHTTLKSARNEAVRVFKCNDWIHRLNFEVIGPSGEKDVVTLNSMSTKFLQWGTISLSLDAEGITGTNSYSFLESSKGGFAIHDEEFSDIPREGYLGEIRCSSESAVISAHSSCIRAPDLIKYKPMTDQIECTSTLIDPFAIFMKGSLPQTRSGYTFTSSKDKKTIQAFNTNSIKALISLNLDDHEIVFVSDQTNCECTFLNLTGCYSCDYGAHVCFRIKSDKKGVFVSNTEAKDISFGFEVLTGTHDYCQIQHFNSPSVYKTLSYSCGGESKLLVIKGSLITIGPHDYRNKTGGASTVVNPSEEGWSVTNWIGGFISWLGGPLKALLKIAVTILAGVVIFLIIYFFLRLIATNILMKTKKN
ncbi:glycoprotein [Sandfly fever Naples virus]|uniref:Envelopment polyprotein n=3 Tax=Phlebovirus TaxID=11584 RepID=A0ABM5MCL6_9VIRU|nr:glycoprotein [Leticia virus]AEL29652.1 glycoprotein [Leticia virus]AEL29664.1 glycoprotein [Sandfly fever Naples virus]